MLKIFSYILKIINQSRGNFFNKEIMIVEFCCRTITVSSDSTPVKNCIISVTGNELGLFFSIFLGHNDYMAFLKAGGKKQIIDRGIFNMISLLKTFARVSLDILLPPKCLKFTNRVESAHALCPDCWKAIQFISDPKCAIRGYPFGIEVSSEVGMTGKNECARALKRAGAEKIFVVTVFRTVSPQELK